MSSAAPIFSEYDRELFKSLVFDPSMKPEFNAVSACLFWDDEYPKDITSLGLRQLRILWYSRAYLHTDNSFAGAGEHEPSRRAFWEQALQEIPTWPGFKRIALSEEDRAFFTKNLGIENPFE
jgi:hypothetical protein